MKGCIGICSTRQINRTFEAPFRALNRRLLPKVQAVAFSVCMIFLMATLFPLSPQAQPLKPVIQDSSAPAREAGAFTLGDLWHTVKANYVGIEVQDAAIDAARLDQRRVESEALPTLQLQAQHDYGSFHKATGGFFPLPGMFNVNGTDRSDNGPVSAAYSYGSATVAWDAFAFGRHRWAARAAGTRATKAALEKAAYLLELKKELADRYIHLLYGDAKLDWARKNAVRLNQVQKITAGLSQAGIRPAADSLLAGASFIQALGKADKWTGIHRADYARLMELVAGRHRQLTGSSGAQSKIDYKYSVKRFLAGGNEKALPLKPGDGYLGHPALAAIGATADYFNEKAQTEQRSALPYLQLLGGYAYRGGGIAPNGAVSGKWQDGFNNATTNFLAGIGIIWNITSLKTNRLAAASLHKSSEQAQKQYQQYQQELKTGLTALEAKIEQQYLQLTKSKQAVEQSRAAFSMYLARYQSGIISLTELLQIRYLLEQAENEQIEAAREFWLLQSEQAALNMDFKFLFNHL